MLQNGESKSASFRNSAGNRDHCWTKLTALRNSDKFTVSRVRRIEGGTKSKARYALSTFKVGRGDSGLVEIVMDAPVLRRGPIGVLNTGPGRREVAGS